MEAQHGCKRCWVGWLRGEMGRMRCWILCASSWDAVRLGVDRGLMGGKWNHRVSSLHRAMATNREATGAHIFWSLLHVVIARPNSNAVSVVPLLSLQRKDMNLFAHSTTVIPM